ncbi:alcohol dehydrogenase catalytic domain-containing protein [Oribacterium sp. oral taxon 102]|uniref:zinc-dependent alcohol dehydrogenase n=1 Tax=Oribacterium sp. oral taxon 102 TaxID=671214 RepID=UPI0015BBC6B2|nr:alcohol dehydrogenase catalytic domain-containing protein [Oribacterium sp. oral taxon 102]NWO21045.1 alcohol dehydrogenase catalytic domain-containing protein [Oribacterium sp. oral taxon 102]
MREYILESPGLVTEREAPVLQPEPGMVQIRVKHVGICGSDIHLFQGTYNGPHHYPMLFGHEWSGQVTAIGEGVTGVSVGDIVTGDCSRYCGSCPACKMDKNLCEHIEKFGITTDGASAEYITREEKYLYKGGEGLSEELLVLSEPLAVAAHLLSRTARAAEGALKDRNILVLGGGVIGMGAMMLLRKIYHCETVALYDLSRYRCEIARSAGAEIPTAEALHPQAEDGSYASLYQAACYDIVIETTGVPSVFASAFPLLKTMGILACVGMAAKVEIPQKQIVTKALTVLGSIGGTGDFPTAMKFIHDFPEEARKLISHSYPMTRVKEAFEAARKPEESMKVVLDL